MRQSHPRARLNRRSLPPSHHFHFPDNSNTGRQQVVLELVGFVMNLNIVPSTFLMRSLVPLVELECVLVFSAEHTHRWLNVLINTRHPERPFVIKFRRPVVLVTSESERKSFSKLIGADLFISGLFLQKNSPVASGCQVTTHSFATHSIHIRHLLLLWLMPSWCLHRACISVSKIRNTKWLNDYKIIQNIHSQYMFFSLSYW